MCGREQRFSRTRGRPQAAKALSNTPAIQLEPLSERAKDVGRFSLETVARVQSVPIEALEMEPSSAGYGDRLLALSDS